MALLRGAATAEGKTVVVVTHDQRIFHFADRICWLENGHLVDTPEPSPAGQFLGTVPPLVFPSLDTVLHSPSGVEG